MAAAVPTAAVANVVDLNMDLSGLRWADIRVGTGATAREGQRVTIDYMMTRQAGAKIYSTKDSEEPFSWVIGDGTVIEGLEIGIFGKGGGVPPMRVGGVRRLLVPQVLGYGSNRGYFKNGTPTEVRDLKPVPPKDFIWVDGKGDRVNAYLRFKDTYMNEMRLDEPGLILDVILKESGAVAVAAAEAPAAAAAAATPAPSLPPVAPATIVPPSAATQAASGESTEVELARLKEQLARLQQGS